MSEPNANQPGGAARFGNFPDYYRFNLASERIKILNTVAAAKLCGLQKATVNALDIGCNSGVLTVALYSWLRSLAPSSDIEVTGVDIDSGLVDQANRRYNCDYSQIKFITLDIMNQDPPLGRYDVLFCFSVTLWIHINHGDSSLEDFLSKVINHQKLGQSKEEFLRLNAAYVASSTHVLLVLTEHSSASPFVFHETLFADWLGKKILIAFFKNDWAHLRPAMKAITGQCLAVDFERNLYTEGMAILEHHLKPMHSLPGVVLEQSYINKMAEGLQPLARLASKTDDVPLLPAPISKSELFLSFQWDVHSKVQEIQLVLESNGYRCLSDLGARLRGHSSLSTRSSVSLQSVHQSKDTIPASSIQHSIRSSSLVVCCITPKYIQSDNCINDLKLAESLSKPVLPLLLQFCSWPPDATLPSVKKALAKCTDIVELYNDKLYKQNLPLVVEHVKKMLA